MSPFVRTDTLNNTFINQHLQSMFDTTAHTEAFIMKATG